MSDTNIVRDGDSDSSPCLDTGHGRKQKKYFGSTEFLNTYNSTQKSSQFTVSLTSIFNKTEPQKTFQWQACIFLQVGDSKEDHRYWGPPEKITYNRPAYRVTESNPGSDVVGEMAAALAAGYIVFKDESKEQFSYTSLSSN